MPKRRPDHIPTRTCAVCRVSHPKREMDRLVRGQDGAIHRDPTGRMPGRGTYICHAADCREPDRAAAAVRRALGAELAPGMLEVEVNDAAT
jgi:predicted RNA-binding protein YlxR (DUF448 family)